MLLNCFFNEQAADYITRMSSLTKQDRVYVKNIDLLYVDCFKSMLSMSEAKLYNITYDKSDIEKLKSNPVHVVYTKKMMINNSPVESKAHIKFAIESFDNASMRLDNSPHPFFTTSKQTYHEWGDEGEAQAKVIGLLRTLGFASIFVSRDEMWTVGGPQNPDGSAAKIFRKSVRRELFEFNQEVTIPPFSKSMLVAFSRPIQGNIPFKAIYELFPSGGHNVDMLENTFKKYGIKEKMDRTNHGSLLVSFDGIIDVDARHEIESDLKTTKLLSSYIF